MERPITFWLYYGASLVTSVRAGSSMTHDDVRRLALMWHDRVPLVDRYETPFERANKIRNARVVTFPGGN